MTQAQNRPGRRGSATPRPTLAAVVLAGGRSTRFKSSVPKVLHPIAGRPLVGHVLETLRLLHRTARLARVVCVVPPGGAVEKALSGSRYPFAVHFAVQHEPLGSADAARIGAELTGGAAELLALAGDVPLLRASTLAALVAQRRKARAAAVVLTADLEDPASYGRVIRREGRVAAIVEARDATPEQLAVREVNTSIYAFDRSALETALPRIRADNAQGEYYLTDAVRVLVDAGETVLAVRGEPDEAVGANTRRQLAQASAILRTRILDALMASGVTVVDPFATYVDAAVVVGGETVLHPGTILEGRTRIGARCEIGPSSRLTDTRVGDGAVVSFSVARSARIGTGAEVGPFAYLAPGSNVANGGKAGAVSSDVGSGSYTGRGRLPQHTKGT